MGDDGNLTWNPPPNPPPGCITSYTITWDDGMFTTPDDGYSVPVDNIPGLEVCRTYTSITVEPNVTPFGAIQSSRGEHLNLSLIPSGSETINHTLMLSQLTQQVHKAEILKAF